MNTKKRPSDSGELETTERIHLDKIPNKNEVSGAFEFEETDLDQFDVNSTAAKHWLGEVLLSYVWDTAKNHQYRLNKFIDFLDVVSESKYEDCGCEDIRYFFFYLANQEGRSEGTIRNYKGTLLKFFKYLERSDFDKPNVPSSWIEQKINPEKISNKKHTFERKHISREEVEQLYNASCSKRNELIARCLYELGLRNGELRELKRDDIDFENKLVTIRDRKNKETDELPIRDSLLIRLDDFIKTERKEYPHANEHDYVFPSPKGGHLSCESITRIIVKMADNAGIQDDIGRSLAEPRCNVEYRVYNRVTPHTLRHSIVTHLIEKDLPKDLIRHLTGHKSDAIEDYIHEDYSSAYDILRNSIE